MENSSDSFDLGIAELLEKNFNFRSPYLIQRKPNRIKNFIENRNGGRQYSLVFVWYL